MRIIIIGGTRFIGPPVVRRLSDQGHTLWLFHRHPVPNQVVLPASVEHITGNRDALDDFRDTFRAIAPDVALDMISITGTHAQAVMRVFKGCARRVVTISSQDVYRAFGRLNGTEPGPPDRVPIDEDGPLREKLYPYRSETPRSSDDPRRVFDDYDKILVERATLGDPDLPGTVLRLPMIYGPGDYQHRLFPYLKRMDDKRPAIIMNEQLARWQWTRDYVDNTAAAIALAVTDDRATGRIYNLGEMPALSLKAWIEAIGAVVGWTGHVVTAPDYQLPEEMQSRAGLEQQLYFDTALIRADLGYAEEVPRSVALRHTVEWERAHPPEFIDHSEFDYAAEDAILTRLNA